MSEAVVLSVLGVNDEAEETLVHATGATVAEAVTVAYVLLPDGFKPRVWVRAEADA